MTGQLIHIRLKTSVYLGLKERNVNMSRVGNELFERYLEIDEVNSSEEIKLQKEADDLREQEEAISKRRSMVIARLVAAREKRELEEKEHELKQKQFASAMKLNNPLREMNLE